jgi:riboflavin biosynthesis pyrimidine reductase
MGRLTGAEGAGTQRGQADEDDVTDRFGEFVSRKVQHAIAAALPRYVTDIERPPDGAIPVGDVWSRRLFDGDFYLSPPSDARMPACSLVFVQSHDGNTGARDPQTLGGGETDKHLIYEGLSRVASDAVLAGGETIRGGRIIFSVWRPELVRLREALGKPRHPIQVVATRRAVGLEHEMLYNIPEVRVVLMTIGACVDPMREVLAARPWITPIVLDPPAGLAEGFARLRALGIEQISCVGGRNLATQMIEAGLVQDIYLTTSPKPGGEPGTPMYPGLLDAEVVVRKRGTAGETGVVFEHLRMR